MAYFKWIALLGLASCTPAWAQSQALPSATQPTATTQSIQAPETQFAESRRLLQQGKYDDALAQLQQLAAKNTGVKGLSHELGTAYYKKGDFIRSIESFKDALQQDPQANEAVQWLGLSYYLSGRPADAIPHLERVQAWYLQANLDASYILGLCYMQTKDYPQARKAFPRRPLSFRRNWRSIPAMPPAITNSRTPTTTHGKEFS